MAYGETVTIFKCVEKNPTRKASKLVGNCQHQQNPQKDKSCQTAENCVNVKNFSNANNSQNGRQTEK